MDPTLQRILDLMKEQGITDVQMQEYIGVPKGTFSNWKRGIGRYFYAYIDQIADRLGVRIDYLVRGEDLTHEENRLIHDFRILTPEARKIISANIKLIVDE